MGAMRESRSKCPMCSTENPEGQLYCGHCGARLAVGAGTEEPYFSYGSSGSRATFTREAYWTRIGVFLALWALPVGLVFEGYVLSNNMEFLALGVGLILIWPFLLGIAVYRVREYRKRMGKK